jgi:hypothetical protein
MVSISGTLHSPTGRGETYCETRLQSQALDYQRLAHSKLSDPIHGQRMEPSIGNGMLSDQHYQTL